MGNVRRTACLRTSSATSHAFPCAETPDLVDPRFFARNSRGTSDTASWGAPPTMHPSERCLKRSATSVPL